MSNADTALHVRGLSRYVDDSDFPKTASTA
jgi:hypothetical protein